MKYFDSNYFSSNYFQTYPVFTEFNIGPGNIFSENIVFKDCNDLIEILSYAQSQISKIKNIPTPSIPSAGVFEQTLCEDKENLQRKLKFVIEKINQINSFQ